jgi:hypothetical protein
MHMKEVNRMRNLTRLSAAVFALLASSALADSTSFAPIATGFTLPNAQNAITASSADTATYADTAGSAGVATSATYATSAGSAKTATSATNATHATSADSAYSAGYATNSGVAQQAAGLTARNNCPAGTALSVANGVLKCVSSVTSITGQLDGSQVVGSLSNIASITTTGNIVSNGYVYGTGGLFSDNGVYSNSYAGRWGAANATFNGTATTANSAGYAVSAGSANYANSSVVGILHQSQPGDGSTFSCDTGYHVVFYDLNVGSTNNSFFYECIQNGH